MSEQTAAPGRPGAVRMIFEYEGDTIRLVSTQRVDVAVTGFDLPAETATPPGHYVQLRSADGVSLAQVAVRNGPTASAEVFPETAGEPIVRTDLERPRGAFTVVVPAAAGARQIAVVEVAHPPSTEGLAPQAGVATTSTDLATFDLDATEDGAS